MPVAQAPAGLSAVIVLLLTSCGGGNGGGGSSRSEQSGASAADRSATDGDLTARPRPPGEDPRPREASGLQTLTVGAGRQGLLYVPSGYSPKRPAPLVVLLHGASSNARAGITPLLGLADTAGLLLLSPEARGSTWDVIVDDYGPDVAAIDALLEEVFERFSIDRSRLAVGGFSDGASYALSLGLINGDLFTHLIGFSPGFTAPGKRRGRPRIFISHGVADRVLPIGRSRRIVRALRGAGYDLDYREFEGGHAVPPDVAREAVDWLADARRNKDRPPRP